MSDMIMNSNQEQYVLLIKKKLSNSITKLIKTKKLKPKDLQQLLDIKQPRVSDLMNSKIEKFSIDSLLEYLNKIGYVIIDYHEDSKEEYINNIKRKIVSSIIKISKENKYRQKELQEMLSIKQPRVSDLMNSKIEKFSIDALLEYLGKIGYQINIGIHDSNKSPISIQFITSNKKLKKSTFGKKFITDINSLQKAA